MIIEQIAFKCDCCGRVYSMNKNEVGLERLPDGNDYYCLPSGWMDMSECDFGVVCNTCFMEFKTVYDRIHGQEKARQQYEEERRRYK